MSNRNTPSPAQSPQRGRGGILQTFVRRTSGRATNPPDRLGFRGEQQTQPSQAANPNVAQQEDEAMNWSTDEEAGGEEAPHDVVAAEEQVGGAQEEVGGEEE